MDAGGITILSQKAAAKLLAAQKAAAAAAAPQEEKTTAAEAGAAATMMNKGLQQHLVQDGGAVTMTREALIQQTCEAVAAKDFVPMQSAFAMESW